MTRETVESALDEIRPMLALHAGNVEFVEFIDGIVRLRLLGTCRGCPLSELTLKAGIEEHLKARISAVTAVEAVA